MPVFKTSRGRVLTTIRRGDPQTGVLLGFLDAETGEALVSVKTSHLSKEERLRVLRSAYETPTGVLLTGGVWYFPVSWLIENQPQHADEMRRFAAMMRKMNRLVAGIINPTIPTDPS